VSSSATHLPALARQRSWGGFWSLFVALGVGILTAILVWQHANSLWKSLPLEPPSTAGPEIRAYVLWGCACSLLVTLAVIRTLSAVPLIAESWTAARPWSQLLLGVIGIAFYILLTIGGGGQDKTHIPDTAFALMNVTCALAFLSTLLERHALQTLQKAASRGKGRRGVGNVPHWHPVTCIAELQRILRIEALWFIAGVLEIAAIWRYFAIERAPDVFGGLDLTPEIVVASGGILSFFLLVCYFVPYDYFRRLAPDAGVEAPRVLGLDSAIRVLQASAPVLVSLATALLAGR
jgi:hypothetical protein